MRRFKHIRTRERFVERANQKHNNFYDYSLVKFENRGCGKTHNGTRTRKLSDYDAQAYVAIICPKHGPFTQQCRKHIEGSGCHKCAIETMTEALTNRNGELDFTTANDFEEAKNCIVIKSTPSDQIEREILINTEDKEILQYCKWHVTGHQLSRRSRTLYCVGQKTNRIVSEGLENLGTQPKLHRLIMSRILGRELKRGEQVDHINHNGLDNRRSNLRIATSAENHANTKKQSGPCSSQYKGVCYDKSRNQWMAYIGSAKGNSIVKRTYLGRWEHTPENEILAAEAYDRAAKKYYGEYANLNFPEDITK
tara:strand:- start:528 stop:1454 length:927 start_codon:yes stop_codon:yes gene_type:complete